MNCTKYNLKNSAGGLDVDNKCNKCVNLKPSEFELSLHF